MSLLTVPYSLLAIGFVVMAIVARKLLGKVLLVLAMFLVIFIFFPELILHLTMVVMMLRGLLGFH